MIPGKGVVLVGDSKEALVSKADQMNCDMVIMGSRGHGALKT